MHGSAGCTAVQGARQCRVHGSAGCTAVQGARQWRVHGSAGRTAVQGARQCRAHGCRMQDACRAGEAARAHLTRTLSPGSPRAEPCHRILSASCSSRLLRAAASLCCSFSHWASAVSLLLRDAFVFGRSRMLGRCGGLTSVAARMLGASTAPRTGGGATPADDSQLLNQYSDQVIRENPANRGTETSAEVSSDQVIRENPASRGTETSAEVLVRSALADGVERRSTAVVRGLSVYSRRRPSGSLRPANRSPPLHPPLQSGVGVGRHRGSTWVSIK
jgi:hypothetical protein